MYDLRLLYRIARDGLTDLAPAVRQAFNDDPTDDRLAQVYGTSPRRNIVLLALAGLALGSAIAALVPNFILREHINWPAILLGAAHAALIRRYLFYNESVSKQDFPWLAASIVPAAVLLTLVSFVTRIVANIESPEGGPFAYPLALLVSAADALGVSAALAIAVAALCYSRQWLPALRDLAYRLFTFKLTVWLMVFLMIEIGIIGPILSRLAESLLGIDVPDWLGDAVDLLSYSALMSVIYLALIGASWTVCRRSFGQLLTEGEVNVVETIATLAKPPAKKKEKKKKGEEDTASSSGAD